MHKRRSSYSPPSQSHHSNPNPNKKPKLPNFPSYHEIPDLSPKIKLLCEIIASTPAVSVEKLLDDTGLRISSHNVEQILKLSYSFPASAVKFFRWSGRYLNHDHSPYAWNLIVDLLGKNSLFDAMWDAVKSMTKASVISLATFASVFDSYVSHARIKDAILSFEVLHQYGVARDVVALNSLLSAISRSGNTLNALDFLRIVKKSIPPDSDTYAILLEGWEAQGNAAASKETFAEMVIEIGWNSLNVPACDSFLCTLLKGKGGIHEALQFFITMLDRGCYPGIKFFDAAIEECLRNSDHTTAQFVWDSMVKRASFKPETRLYNKMIALYCYNDKIHASEQIFDEMICNGAFPNTQTYNLLFQFFIKFRKLSMASVLFNEMIKNECVPKLENCMAAIKFFISAGEAYMAIKVWKYLIENHDSHLDETGNLLVVGLRDLDMVPEAVKYAENMIEKGLKLSSASLSKLKQSLHKARKDSVYDDLLKKWKAH